MNSSTLPPLLAAAGVDLQAAEALAAGWASVCCRREPSPGGFICCWMPGGLALADGPQLLRGDFSRLLPQAAAP